LNHDLTSVVVSLLQSVLQIVSHLFLSNADKVDVELKSKSRLECDINLLLGTSINESLMVVKVEALLKDFLRVGHLLCTFLQSHLQFDIQVAVALVGNDNTESLREAHSNGAKVKVIRLDDDGAITASTNDFNLFSDINNALVRISIIAEQHLT